MDYPLVYELNARCWLRDLSDRLGKPVRLGDVPGEEIAAWKRQGFTHIWLMGAWRVGPRSRAAALANEQLRKLCSEILPDFRDRDLTGSAFAIADYKVARELGGETGLRKFRQQLNGEGIRLLLDFVPNHVGLDHPWVLEHPEWFVHSSVPMPETFPQAGPGGELWLAHGKDPNFLAWADTAQFDYRQPALREAVIAALKQVARRCDGVRCDLAMLQLNDIFVSTWQAFPSLEPPPATEFWSKAIEAVKTGQPEFLFLGEVYWGLEARLQELGFDYTYDKALYDYVVACDYPAVHRHLSSRSKQFTRASAHFLENHDEPRIATLLSPEEHQPAALLMLGLPGMRLVHEGQLSGARVRTPIELARRTPEAAHPGIQAMYERLFGVLGQTAVGRGEGTVVPVRPAWADNCSCAHFVVVQWQAEPTAFDLVVVNLADCRSQCYAQLEIPDLAKYNWRMVDLLGEENYERCGDDLATQGLYLDVPPHAAQLFHFQPL